MAWTDGDILFSSNFDLRVAKPLDAKQIVPTNVDLNSITFPYDGLIVHVTATQETYVCIDKDGVSTGAPLGVIDADVWKVVGGAAADVLVLPDQSPAPSGIADKSQLVSLDDATAESRPDFLYRFNEGVDDATATDDGRLQANGTKYNTDGDGYGATSGGAFGDNYAVFSPAKDPRISVGTAGAAAPFYFTSDTGDRGDFEIQFRFSYEADDANYSLLSTQLTSASTEGFYAILIDTDVSGVNVEFRSRHLIDGVLTSFSAEWKTGASGSFTKQASRHLVISFMEDDRSITGNTDGSGKLRCYWDGVVCEDDKNAGAYYVAAPEFNNIGRRSSDGTVWALNLGQFLDGSSSGSPAPDIYFLDGKMDEFVVYNHRCLHNTSDKFTRPAVPTRSTALSMPNVVDSEGTASPIITTSNPGMLLPKSVEGVADGSLWNDKGVVKIAPLTGDLDALGADVVTLPASSAAPAATAGTAKIYSKLDTFDADLLLHFEDGVDDSSGEGNDGSVIQGTPTYGISTSGGSRNNATFGKAIDFRGAQAISFPDLGIGTGDFTVEFFVNFDNAQSGVSVVFGYAGSAPGPGHLQVYRYNGVWYTLFWDHTLGTPAYTSPIPWTETLVDHTWYHVALVREGSDLSFYRDGVRKVHVTSHPVDFVIGGVETWAIGRIGNITTYQTWGQVDEFLITKTAKYSDATYTVPSAPYATKTNLYAMDGLGNEFKLT